MSSIGFFDSGIGGLSVLREALKILPNENYIYYADTRHVPYGVKPKEEVKQYVFQAVAFMAAQGIKGLVIACNTATSIAVKELREMYQFPIVGMEPAVKPAVERNGGEDKRVLVLATPLTLREEKFQNLVDQVDCGHIVDFLPLPELVMFAEQLEFSQEVVGSYLTSSLAKYNLKNYGTIVLGCTHFPFFKSVFQKVLPPHIDLIDGNVGTVKHLKNVLEEAGVLNRQNNLTGAVQALSAPQQAGQVAFYASGQKITDNVILAKYRRLLSE